MKIKSLLLGSAAALVAVSGARAADAVVIPEPEAVEYVRVCDAAGAGYFYIPGSETCLRISGYVRYDAGFGELNGVDNDLDGDDDTWFKQARLSLRTHTWSDTELGALTTYTETRFNYNNGGNTGASLNFAYIDLAGLRIGKSESAFTTFTGYAGAVINDTTGGGYGPFDTNLIQYNYSNGALSAVISLEQGAPAWQIDDYMPHVVAGLGYDAGAFQVRGVVGYDTANDGWAAKLRADADLGSFSAFAMLMYTDDSAAYGTWLPFSEDGFSVIAGASADFSDNLTGNVQVQWVEDSTLGGDDRWAVAANVNYTVVPGFVVTPEIQYATVDGDGAFGGVIRFQRSF